ncbi:probable L-type lectin-domain containing receptor kinase S.5 [Magnolia sinica]|uniref:probable L-type lectin-domain containing receptor kinase S.5 n=1 Tax=Magnolia sinica TaxID=86752 RepID=UPI00265A8AEA|nr:probable L-type lectin-domain containing receptor kinase S.5 [Magnolia sinica]
MGTRKNVSSPTIFLLLLTYFSICIAQNLEVDSHNFGPFDSTYYDIFSVEKDATISNQALQITPDSNNDNFALFNRSGRVIYNKSYKLWEGDKNDSSTQSIVSFNSTFIVNIYRPKNETAGEGLAFVIVPNHEVPIGSHGQWLGLTNATIDGNPSNQFIAIELDTVKQSFDVNDNHIGLDINSIRSDVAYNLSQIGIQIAPEVAANYTIWVQYNGNSTVLDVYIAKEGDPKPANPVINRPINIKEILNQNSYFGFAASTGSTSQLNCVLKWNLSVEIFPKDKGLSVAVLVVAIVVPIVAVAVIIAGILGYCMYRKRRKDDSAILGTLKSLPGTPREFRFRDLKKATNNFDERLKLGQGGFGVVYKGVLPKENTEVAVKKFSRENMKGKDDFLAELSIINRLRHKHLVRLVGWCHRNGMLLLVYDYMPNGSLDNHLFGGPEKILNWQRRYNIIAGVVSALHYLHDEYDQKVVHRDLKASNVLLDSDYNARLGDFGLARALDNEKTSYAELEGVPGTMGYIAPECFHTGKATRESDVYGFGAVVLEVVCGQRPRVNISSFQFLVDWVWTLYREGRILEAVDERLGEDFVPEEAERLLKLGLACSHPTPRERPKTQSIVQIISGSVPPPYVPPIKPAFVWPMEMGSSIDISSLLTSDTTPMTSSYYGSGWTPQYQSQDSNAGHSNISTAT